ncbi:peptidyl-tRNA hydrolase [Volucribacter psittacicida]|uniref:Peptidyl-tRNA hydrolase n=1 Tax=Volucribacter psittacicida TaxID=203482 RepID=A0A4R1G4X0_9PAST|nr:aminoacyl-tRNA hydrolase [Volucribacter psittacicida]TCK01543.1 peptidyl-tRNA hydrolase [Volucribacter psittacicida]
MAEIKLIVGLGNPGEKYAETRHNAGEWFIEGLAKQFGFQLKPEAKFFGKTARTLLNGEEVRFLVPTTFMNLSGKAVSALANFYRIKPEQILIAHDELDLPVGVAKIKQGGGHGGHNGLRDSIAQLANNKNFYRLRIGIGHPGSKELVAPYVLSKPSPNDRAFIDQALQQAVKSIDLLFKQGIVKATNQLNAFKAN